MQEVNDDTAGDTGLYAFLFIVQRLISLVDITIAILDGYIVRDQATSCFNCFLHNNCVFILSLHM